MLCILHPSIRLLESTVQGPALTTFAMSLRAAGWGDGPSSVPRLPGLRISQTTACIALAAAFAPMALGHGGHEVDKIPEGATISVDPIVGLSGWGNTKVTGR